MRLLVFCLCLPSLCFSQQTIDAEQFFARGLSAYEPVELSAGEKVHFPWVNRYEFRTETRDFDLDQQEYTVRLTPSTAKIRQAQKAFYEELRNAPDFEGEESYCDLVLSLHLDWLSLFVLTEHNKILEEWMVILNDKQTIYERMAGTYEFDPQKLLELQTEKSDLEISLIKTKLERDVLLHKYGIQDQEIDFGAFATVEAIAAYLANTVLPSQNDSVFVDGEAEHKKQLLIREIDLESSEKRQLIDFVQLKYNGPHSDLLQERLSVGVGFQLSNSGNKKLKMQELQIELAELNRKAARDSQEKLGKINTLENELQSDIQAFFRIQEIMKEERAQLQKLSGKISQKEGSSPLILLEIEERNLSMKIKSLNKKEDFLKDYLKYLHQSDQLCQSTFVNFLDP